MAVVTESQTVIQRSTYSLAGQAIALRVAGSPLATNNGLFYLYSDHASALLSTGLGSASALVTGGGQKVNETRYLPFGGYRSGGPNTITDRGFTGQKENMELGLLYYNARFYAPGLGRFLSADTIVPNPTNPQSLNRYSYTRNSPLNLIDPTGHRECGDDCNDPLSATGITWIAPFSSPYIEFTGSGWQRETKQTIHGGASRIANRMANAVNPLLRLEAKMEGNGFVPLSPEEVWAGTFDGPITFNKTNAPCVVTKGCLAWMDEDAARQINVKSMTYAEHAVHEIFHILDLKVLGGVPSQALRAVQASDPTFPRRPGGLTQDTDQSFGFGSGVIGPYQKSYSSHPAEEVADMGIGWTFNQWERNTTGTGWSTQGQARANFMGNMGFWLSVKLNQ
ncbi:MAG: RHS repeat-associated core domain-containing protein [Chloroflexi bacterium]|nr:RHS repeat-associated core domain-containing protein [Chloroflexota bacterium]